MKSFLPGSLVSQIIVGLGAGVLLATVWPEAGSAVGILGDFFVDALKAVAPVLVLILVCAAITNHKKDSQAQMGPVVSLYVLATFSAALLAVAASFMSAAAIAGPGSKSRLIIDFHLAHFGKNVSPSRRFVLINLFKLLMQISVFQ